MILVGPREREIASPGRRSGVGLCKPLCKLCARLVHDHFLAPVHCGPKAHSPPQKKKIHIIVIIIIFCPKIAKQHKTTRVTQPGGLRDKKTNSKNCMKPVKPYTKPEQCCCVMFDRRALFICIRHSSSCQMCS